MVIDLLYLRVGKDRREEKNRGTDEQGTDEQGTDEVF
jgi:hypothetical protein